MSSFSIFHFGLLSHRTGTSPRASLLDAPVLAQRVLRRMRLFQRVHRNFFPVEFFDVRQGRKPSKKCPDQMSGMCPMLSGCRADSPSPVLSAATCSKSSRAVLVALQMFCLIARPTETRMADSRTTPVLCWLQPRKAILCAPCPHCRCSSDVYVVKSLVSTIPAGRCVQSPRISPRDARVFRRPSAPCSNVQNLHASDRFQVHSSPY